MWSVTPRSSNSPRYPSIQLRNLFKTRYRWSGQLVAASWDRADGRALSCGWSWEHDSNEEIAEKLLQVQPNRAAVVAQKIVAPKLGRAGRGSRQGAAHGSAGEGAAGSPAGPRRR